MNSAVAMNFRVAVWVTVLGGLALFARGASDFDAVSEVYRGYAAQAIAGPLVLAMITTLFWFLWYREGSGHWPAFGVGAMLLVAAAASSPARRQAASGTTGRNSRFSSTPACRTCCTGCSSGGTWPACWVAKATDGTAVIRVVGWRSDRGPRCR